MAAKDLIFRWMTEEHDIDAMDSRRPIHLVRTIYTLLYIYMFSYINYLYMFFIYTLRL